MSGAIREFGVAAIATAGRLLGMVAAGVVARLADPSLSWADAHVMVLMAVVAARLFDSKRRA